VAKVEHLIANVRTLPALPASANRALTLLVREDASVKELEEIVRTDEALSMTVMRVANSGYFGVPGKTFTLRESITRLGGKPLLRIILEQQMAGMFNGAGRGYGLRRGALWRGALGGAVAAEWIATANRFESPETCFLCGLLRDVGKLVLDDLPDMARVTQLMSRDSTDRCFLEIERTVFGMDHAAIGGALAERWSLPDRICEAIRHHHEPPDGDEADELIEIVHAADIVCLWAGLAVGCDGMKYPLHERVRDRYLPKRSSAEMIIAQTWEELGRFEAMYADAGRQTA